MGRRAILILTLVVLPPAAVWMVAEAAPGSPSASLPASESAVRNTLPDRPGPGESRTGENRVPTAKDQEGVRVAIAVESAEGVPPGPPGAPCPELGRASAPWRALFRPFAPRGPPPRSN